MKNNYPGISLWRKAPISNAGHFMLAPKWVMAFQANDRPILPVFTRKRHKVFNSNGRVNAPFTLTPVINSVVILGG